jgi:dTDP-4-dehydrorhamnose 3,5-epimerase
MSFPLKIKKNKNLRKVLEINPSTYKNKQGVIFSLLDPKISNKILPLSNKFKHIKITKRKKNSLVGIHHDSKTWKLFGCINGSIFHNVSCLDKKDKQYLKSTNFILSEKKIKFILIPPSYGNSFYCLTDATIIYCLSYPGKYNDIEKQQTIIWNDKSLSIKWPSNKPNLTLRDKKGLNL